MRRRVVALSAVLLVTLGVAGCGSDDNGGVVEGGDTTDTTAATATTGGSPDGGQAKTVEVKAANFAFDPTAIQLTAGEMVVFSISNGDTVKHNLTIEGFDVDQDVDGGATAEGPAVTVPGAGTYKYSCEYHPAQMQGTVTVT